LEATEEQIADVLKSLQSKGIACWRLRSQLFPDIVIVDEHYGVICLDILIEGYEQEEPDLVNKNARKKIYSLVKEFELRVSDFKFNYQRHVIPAVRPEKGYRVKLQQREDTELNHSEKTLAFSLAISFGERIAVQKQVEPIYDAKAADTRRLVLDEEQSAIAKLAGTGVTIVEGLPGSGKSLVLAARANYLNSLHPSWKIYVVCFNNSLKPYLQKLVTPKTNIVVETFYEFRSRNVDRFSMKNATEKIALDQLNKILHISKDSDAILVDEAQDFLRAWIYYLAKKVKDDRGGLMLVADKNQSIYRNAEIEEDFQDLNPTYYYLNKTYRSTKQIIEFTNVLIPECAIPEEDLEIEGPKPRLVWVQGGLKKPDVKRAIALDITEILKNDREVKLSDIGILCSRRFTMMGSVREISESLTELNDFVPQDWISPLFDTKSYEPDRNSIKMMTIHSSKGLEFKYVFLLGLEELAKEYHEEISSIGNISDENLEVRLNFVGPTRASRELNVYYSRHNLFLDRLLANRSVFKEVIYPESYEVPEQWQD